MVVYIIGIIGCIFVFYLIFVWIPSLISKYQAKRNNKRRRTEIFYKIENGIYEQKFKVNDDLFMVNIGVCLDNLQGGKRFWGGKTGFINQKEEYLIPMKYDMAFSYYHGLIEVKINDEGSGIVNEKGIEVLPCKYELKHLNCELWVVGELGKFGVCNKEGILVTPIKYDKLAYGIYYNYSLEGLNVDDEKHIHAKIFCFIAQVDNKVGLVNVEGSVVIPLIYDYLTILDECYMIAKLNGEFGLLDPSGYPIIPFNNNVIKKVSNILIGICENGLL
jgi:hypothetical protein